MLRTILTALAALASLAALPNVAQARLQCVTYARQVSDVQLSGNARDWWGNAAGTYARGQEPKAGAVLAFRASRAMPYGHVAVVSKVVDARHVMINHANWSRPGMVERGVMAVDVSAAGDWSEVRVWYGPTQSLGMRPSPPSASSIPTAPRPRRPPRSPRPPPSNWPWRTRPRADLALSRASNQARSNRPPSRGGFLLQRALHGPNRTSCAA
ncbi:CHAP domain-containing protein [Novosphingobium pokkalii]|uniref:CHAP domain-containing protein n=1 Tax=Novosphingobium pokkalii TaxID=1770194 RepID=UPI0036329071